MPIITSTFEHVERLIEADEYRSALDLLQKLFREGLIVSDSIEMLKYQLMISNCYYKLNKFEEAQKEIKPAFVLSRLLSDDFMFAEAKYLSGQINIAIGNTDIASEEFNEAYVFYKRSVDHENVVHSLSMLARCYFLKGQYQRSKEYLLKAIDAAIKTVMDSNHIAGLMNNLCKTALRLGDHSLVEQQIEKLKQFEISTPRTIHFRFAQILLSLQTLDFSLADQLLQDVRPLLAELGLPIYEIIYNEYSGLLEYLRGNYSEAREYYRQVLDMPEPTASAKAQTLRMLTDVCIAEGNFNEALKTAKKAEKAITKINERIELGALYRAYGQIYTYREDYDTAHDYFSKSISLLREIGARYELALTYFECGESDAFGYNTKMRYLESARLLFDEMDVPKRVEQVQGAIDELKHQSVPNIIISSSDIDKKMIVASPAMKRLVSLAEKIATTDLTVLLTGETGVGKDVFARHIHDVSGRKGNFVTFNAAAVPQDMIESELFGYREGAFTGAVSSKVGLFEMAEGGTFYLNEIADASPEFQAKLLEVLETHEVRRLGETTKRRVNFRLIAATNRDLKHEADEGRFRPDLYYRLEEISFVVPPLRVRKEDIPCLVTYFIESMAKDACSNGYRDNIASISNILALRQWPGNIRELRSEVRRLLVESHYDITRMKALLQDFEARRMINKLIETLKVTKWNRREAARILGISDTTVRNWIKRYNLTPDSPLLD